MGELVATIVGVSDPRRAGFASLPGVAGDVRRLRSLLGKATRSETLQGATATVNAVHDAIIDWHSKLGPGDTFVFAYSGHGAQRPSPGSKETDELSESLVLADGFYRDVTLRSALHGFEPGVNVVAVIDACHGAGTTYIVDPLPAPGGIVHRRGLRVPGATSLTLAAASEDKNAQQRRAGRDYIGQLVDCLSRAYGDGTTAMTWGELWNQTSRWWLGLGYEPAPEAWLDGPNPDDEAILDALALRP